MLVRQMNCPCFLWWKLRVYSQKSSSRVLSKALQIAMQSLIALGSLLGMFVFHHKTQKPKFYITVPLLLLVQIGLIVFLLLKFFI